MAEPYLQALGAMLDQALDRGLDREPESDKAPGLDGPITRRHFFSGAAAYTQGRIFMTLTPAGLALKLPEDARARLIGEGAVPLRTFATGPVKKDYVVMPRSLAEDPDALTPWIEKSIGFVRTLPKPRTKKTS